MPEKNVLGYKQHSANEVWVEFVIVKVYEGNFIVIMIK